MATRKVLVLILAVLHLSACKTWTPTTVSPPHVFVLAEPLVRITRTGNEQVIVRYPVVRADSIIGTGVDRTEGEMRVAISDIRSIEVRRFSALATGRAVAITAGAWAALFLVASCSGEGGCLAVR